MLTNKKDPNLISIILLAFFVNGLFIFDILFPQQIKGYRAIITLGLIFPFACLELILSKKKYKPSDIFFIFTLLIETLVLLININSSYGISKVKSFIIFNFLPSLLILLIVKDDLRRIRVLVALLAFFSIFSIIRLYLLKFGFSEWVNGNAAWQMRQLGMDVIGINRNLGLGAILCYCFFLITKSPKRYLLLSVLIILLILQFFVHERGPIIATWIVLSLAWLMLYHGNNRFIIALLFIAFDITIFFILSKIDLRFSLESLINDPRIELYKLSLEAFFKSPIIGIGTGAFQMGYTNLSTRVYSHNIFLELLVENGLVGILIFLLFLCCIIAKICKLVKSRTNYFSVIIILLFVYSMINSQVSGDITNNNLLWISASLLMAYPIRLTNNELKVNPRTQLSPNNSSTFSDSNMCD